MTAIAPPRGTRPERKPSPTRPGRAPVALWVLGLVAVVPAVSPIVYLLWNVARAGVTDTSGMPPGRLLDLFLSTALLVVAVTTTTAVLGTATAWLTTRTDLRG